MSEHTPWKLRVSQTAKHMGGRGQLWHTKRGRLASFTSGGDEYACEEVLAKLNAFHDPAGRTIATEDIAPELFWRMYDLLNEIDTIISESKGVDGWHLNGAMAPWGEFEEPNELNALLSSLKVQGPET